MNTYLSIMQAVAVHAGIEPMSTVVGDDPDCLLIGRFVNEAGAEVAQRVDWSVLRRSMTLPGTGRAGAYALPADFARLTPGLSVSCGWSPVRGSLTADEWAACPAGMTGMPRYFILSSGRLEFWPCPRATDTLTVTYQSGNWALSGADVMTVGADAPLIPDDLLVLGALWRWRRHVGKDYADHMAEFEARLSARAAADSGARQP